MPFLHLLILSHGLFVQSVNMIHYICWFVNVGESCVCSWKGLHVFMMFYLLYILLGKLGWCFLKDFTLFIGDISQQFFFNVFVWFWHLGNIVFGKWLESSFYALEKIIENCYYFFLKCLEEVSRITIWAWCFLLLKYLTPPPPISISDIQVPIYPWWILAVWIFKELAYFINGIRFMGIKLLSCAFIITYNIHIINSDVPLRLLMFCNFVFGTNLDV